MTKFTIRFPAPQPSERTRWEDRTHTRTAQMRGAASGYHELSVWTPENGYQWTGMVHCEEDGRWRVYVWVQTDWEEVGIFDTLEDAKTVCTATALLEGS